MWCSIKPERVSIFSERPQVDASMEGKARERGSWKSDPTPPLFIIKVGDEGSITSSRSIERTRKE